MANNMDRLGNVLSSRMLKTTNANSGVAVELGVVNSDLSVTPDSLQAAIPQGEYMINLLLDGIKSGDRVLVAWAGNEPVVLAIVTGS